MAQYRFLNDPATCTKLLEWWKWLDGNEPPYNVSNGRGDRARLRRVESPDDALLTDAFYNFLQRMPDSWSEPKHLLASALVAVIVAQVKVDQSGSNFAAQLATPKDSGDKPRMSELLFRQLQKSHDPTEFFRRLLRAVRMLDCNVNILSLVNDMLHWMHEYQKGIDRNPQKRLTFCWANDYYTTLLNKQTKKETKGGNTP